MVVVVAVVVWVAALEMVLHLPGHRRVGVAVLVPIPPKIKGWCGDLGATLPTNVERDCTNL